MGPDPASSLKPYVRAPDQEREAGEDEEQYSLSRFVPLLQEVLEDAAADKLSADDYPFVSAPTPTGAPAWAPCRLLCR